MKLLSINQARAIWLFLLTDLNPRGKASEKDALIEIGKRYGFTISPTRADFIVAREKNQPLKYLQGTFTPRGKDAVTVDLLIYRDGIIADTRSSTADSAEFIADLLTWGNKELGLLPWEEVVRTKLVLSDVHVSCDRSLALLNPKLTALAKKLSSKVSGHPGAEFELGAIGLWADQQPTPPAAFRFERAEGVPFAQNRYYSVAPLETEEHLQFLDELEALLTR